MNEQTNEAWGQALQQPSPRPEVFVRKDLVYLKNKSGENLPLPAGQGLGPPRKLCPQQGLSFHTCDRGAPASPLPRLSVPSGSGLGRLWTAGSLLRGQTHYRRPP